MVMAVSVGIFCPCAVLLGGSTRGWRSMYISIIIAGPWRVRQIAATPASAIFN